MTDQELEQEIRRRLRETDNPDRARQGIIETVLGIAKEEGARDPQTQADPGTKARKLPAFVTIPPNKLPGPPHHRVPTTESPGAISTGHVLQYFGGKLETFQPKDTPITRRVHPLTVRVAPHHPVTNTIRSNPDLRWAVIHLGQEYMVLAPVPAPRVRELTGASPHRKQV